MQEVLEYKPLDDQRIKINVDIKSDHLHPLYQKNMFQVYDLIIT